jgi:SAM-dependent methyltransferase
MTHEGKTTWHEVADEYASFVHEKYIHFPALVTLFREEQLDGKNIVDIGSGVGISSRVLAEEVGCNVTGVEISEDMVKRAKASSPEIEFTVGDARNLPIQDESFDGAMMATLLSNFSKKEDIEQTLAEGFRVLKPEGKLVITIPHPCFEEKSYPGARERTFADPYNYANEGQQYSLKLFREDGEDVTVTNYHWPLHTYLEAISKAGFKLSRTLEPQPTKELGDESKYPVYLILVAQKP